MIEWNTVKYIDCMDEKEGLPSLPDKSIDLCITSPPFNIGYKGKSYTSETYNDYIPNYRNWCRSWLDELKRICKLVFVETGTMNLRTFIYIRAPIGILYHQTFGTTQGSKISNIQSLHPYVVYGELNKRFKSNPIRCDNSKDNLRGKSIHPCPFNSNFIIKVLQRQEPKTVIDPFIGSGTVAYCCNQLDIKWIGYEKNKKYKEDIEWKVNIKKIPWLKKKEKTSLINF